MAELHFLRPEMLIALALLALVWWLLWRGQDSYARLREMVAPHLLEHLVVDEGHKGALRPLHLLAVIWILSALALAGPTWEREPSPFADDDAGLVVLLKVSGTMEATDVQPSRLARAKHKLRDLLALRKGSATGLIVYSGSAHLVMPLTRDECIVSAMVEDLSPALMPVDGDALADALRMAEALLKRAGVPGSALVLADGVSPAQARAAADAAPSLPVQFLAVSTPSAPLDGGLDGLAATRGAPVLRLSADDTDVRRATQRAQSAFTSVAGGTGGERWRDAGYLLLPLIALLALTWARRGWLVR
jgi:Ca-activated chloride channel family protein